MTRKPDRRSQRTRAALLKAFAQIMLSEGFEAVTVNRVCDRADVGRSTFYLHFAGKEGILRESLAGPSGRLATLVDADVTAESLRPLLEHFHQQRKINAVCFAHPVRGLWARRLADIIEPKLALRMRTVRARPSLPLQAISTQIAEAQLGLIAAWLVGYAATAPATIAESVINVTRALLAALLRCEDAALRAAKP